MPHDVEGLISLYKSKKNFAGLLDTFFGYSFYWPLGNFMPNMYFWVNKYSYYN